MSKEIAMGFANSGRGTRGPGLSSQSIYEITPYPCVVVLCNDLVFYRPHFSPYLHVQQNLHFAVKQRSPSCIFFLPVLSSSERHLHIRESNCGQLRFRALFPSGKRSLAKKWKRNAMSISARQRFYLYWSREGHLTQLPAIHTWCTVYEYIWMETTVILSELIQLNKFSPPPLH
jgi:hypothetical protein